MFCQSCDIRNQLFIFSKWGRKSPRGAMALPEVAADVDLWGCSRHNQPILVFPKQEAKLSRGNRPSLPLSKIDLASWVILQDRSQKPGVVLLRLREAYLPACGTSSAEDAQGFISPGRYHSLSYTFGNSFLMDTCLPGEKRVLILSFSLPSALN